VVTNLLFNLLNEGVRDTPRRNEMSQEWKINGTYCEAACPCIFLSDPTEGDCTALVAWHIDAAALTPFAWMI
jgi:hypothetical protein